MVTKAELSQAKMAVKMKTANEIEFRSQLTFFDKFKKFTLAGYQLLRKPDLIKAFQRALPITDIVSDLMEKQDREWEAGPPKKAGKNRIDHRVVNRLPKKGTPEYIAMKAFRDVAPDFMKRVAHYNSYYNLDWRKVMQHLPDKTTTTKKTSMKVVKEDYKPF